MRRSPWRTTRPGPTAPPTSPTGLLAAAQRTVIQHHLAFRRGAVEAGGRRLHQADQDDHHPGDLLHIVLGIGSIAKAATVGKVGGLALGYFITMSTFALAIGLGVGNLVHPGDGLKLKPYKLSSGGGAAHGTLDS